MFDNSPSIFERKCVEAEGSVCPACGSTNTVSMGSPIRGGKGEWKEMFSCLDCNAYYKLVFKATAAEVI